MAVQAANGVGGGVAIGTSSNCNPAASVGQNESVAVGCGSVADEAGSKNTNFFDRGNPYHNVSKGTLDTTGYYRSTSVGTGAKAYEGGTALGMKAQSAALGVALGAQAKSEDVAAIAVGPAALAKGNTSLAIGRQSIAEKDFAQAIGNVSAATGKGSLAMGHSATATGNRSIAIGSADIDNAGNTGNQQGTVYQTQEQTLSTGKDSIAFGAAAKATKDHTLAIGAHSNAEGVNALALGAHSKADKDRSIAVGVGAKANFIDSVALGSNSEVLHDNSVAVGRRSKTNAYNQQAFLVGGVATGAVAVGSVGDERRLQNVAAGALDTDGVNVSQLKQHKTITDKTGGDIAKHLGGDSTFNSNTGEITNPTYNIGGADYSNVESALKASKTEVKEGANIKVSEDKGADGQTIYTVRTADDVTFTNVTSETMTVNNRDSVANGGDTNYVTEGNKSVVNGGDVYAAINTTEQQYTGDNGEIVKRNPTQVLTIKGGATTATENNIQTVANEDGSIAVKLAEKINLGAGGNVQLGNTLVDNSGVTITGGTKGPVSITNTGLNNGGNTITNVGPGVNGTDAVNVNQLTTKVAAATTEVKAGTNVAGVTTDTGKNGQTIYTVNAKGTTATAGSDAITVGGTTDNTTNITDYKVDLSQGTKDSLNKADSALQTVVTQIDGDNVKTINKDNNTANFVTGTNIKLESEYGGIKVSTADDVTFTNVTSETMTVNNRDSVANGGDTNYVTEGNKSVVNGGDVYAAINTTEQQYTGDNGEIVKRNPTQVLTIKGGATTATENNIQTVANADGSIAVKLAEKINLGAEGNVQLGNTLVDNSGVTITGGTKGPVSITNTGLNNGGNTITNVGPGVNGTDAVNVNQLTETNTTIAKGFNITADNSELADNATEDNVKLGETVKYTSADGNIVTTVRDNKIDFGLGKDLTVGDDNEPGTIIVKGEDGKDGVSINGADGTIALNGKDGANGTISVKNGVPGVNGQDGITRIVIDDNEVATMKDGLKFQGNTGEVIGKQLNETLTVKGELGDDANASGANLRVDSDGNNLNLVMAKDLTDLDSIIINNGGPIINSTGINMGGKKITKVAAGTQDDDAVNLGQLNKVSGDVNKGLNFTGDDATIVINRQLGDALTIRGGATGSLINGNIGVVVNGNQLEVKMAENIDLGDNGSVTTGDSVVNNDGLTIAGGPSVTKDGIDAGDKKITGVAKGDISKDSTDAVNGSQLWDIKNKIDKGVAASKTEVEEGKNITVKEEKGADGQTIYKVSTSDEVEFDKVDVGSVSIDKNKVDKDGNTIISGVGAGKADTDAVNVGQLKDVVAGANKGFNVTAQGKNESNVANGGSIDFNNTDGNIKVQKATGSNDISFNLNPSLDLGKEGSITTGDTKVNNSGVTTGNTSLTNNGITINNAKPDSQDYDENKTVSVTDKGLNNGGNRITNVGPGVDGTDAVNMNQLKDFGYNLGNKIDKVGDEANAGVSSAMAMAALPQAYIPGKSMVTGGMATYNGQGAVAVGISKLSDNGRWVLKISGSADTEGNAGGAVGAGFHF
ncbi:YadA-like family protein [Psychrobacter piechaudii]|uniref:YadA-like family protein n=1 Tax=Psychrobacter piechaudii TaxID=1945521 RepID=UPI001FC992FD|nr:YadA-like family protein [Psychrobacter piechaudii]